MIPHIQAKLKPSLPGTPAAELQRSFLEEYLFTAEIAHSAEELRKSVMVNNMLEKRWSVLMSF
jgi:hypothetical protein